jgi:hypothetical protein
MAQRPSPQQDQDVNPRQASLPWSFSNFNEDRNGEGILTVEEVLGYLDEPVALKLTNDQVTYKDIIEEADEVYRGKQSYKVLTVRLEQGKTYQIDHASEAFQAFLYLEDAEGGLLEENSSPAVGGHAAIVYRAGRTGTYRLIATSRGGFRTGPFVLSVRLVAGP